MILTFRVRRAFGLHCTKNNLATIFIDLAPSTCPRIVALGLIRCRPNTQNVFERRLAECKGLIFCRPTSGDIYFLSAFNRSKDAKCKCLLNDFTL